MAPELGRIPEQLQHLIETEAPPNISDLKTKAEAALAANDFQQLNELSSKIIQMRISYHQDLQAAIEPLHAFIEKYQLGEIFISAEKLTALDKATITIDIVDSEVDSTFTKKRPNASILALIDTIALDKNKNTFVYNTVDEIAVRMLLPENATDTLALKRAKSTYSYAKSTIAKATVEDAQILGVQSIKEVYSHKMETEKNPDKLKFFQTAIEVYGEMKPEDFVKNVLNRFLPTPKNKPS